MKVLIVDDSSVMRKMVLQALRQAGMADHEFEEAGNGVEAMEKIGAAQPDVILCDWNMPEMNGIDLLRRLREDGLDMPFCFITSEATQAMRGQASEAGARAFITKPFTSESLRDALSDVLD